MSLTKSSLLPSGIHAISRSRPGVSVTRTKGERSSMPFTYTSPYATSAIDLPSGESCASLTSRPTARGRTRSASSSVPWTASFTGCAPGFVRSMRCSASHTVANATRPSADTASSRTSSGKFVTWVPPSAAGAVTDLRHTFTVLPSPRSVR